MDRSVWLRDNDRCRTGSWALGRNRERLEQALQVGAITDITCLSDDLVAGLAEVELIIVCTPVGLIVDQIRQLAEHAQPGTLFTDGGSTKRSIAEALDGPLARDCRFIGSHPLAGSEKTGVAHSANGFVRGPCGDDHAHRELSGGGRRNGWQRSGDRWGSKVVRITPDEHDRAMAATSHMPHAIAVALAASLPGRIHEVDGFWGLAIRRDWLPATPDMWQQIFLDNRQHVGASIGRFAEQLQQLADLIEDADATALEEYLTQAKKRRDALGS